jgi:hypothetical protein
LGWGDAHRLALVTGAIIASMLAGYIESGIQLPVDLVGKLAFNLLAVLLLVSLGNRIHQQKAGGNV